MRLRSLISSAVLTFAPTLWKQRLRNTATRKPLADDYPFDPEAKLLRSVLRPNDVFFDVGANAGFYSIMAEDIVGEQNLILFEPLPHLHTRLKLLFRNSTVLQLAVSDTATTTTIRIPLLNGVKFETCASIASDVVEPGQTGYEELSVQTTTIDRSIQESSIASVRCIKIDVEGHELAILEGAKDTIARHHPILLVEIEQRHHQTPIQEIFAGLNRLHYTGFFLEPNHWRLLPIERFDVNEHQCIEHLEQLSYKKYVNNFFFCHESEQAAFQQVVQSVIDSERAAGLKR